MCLPIAAKDAYTTGTAIVMKAVICREFAPRSGLALEDVASPMPARGQVLIDIKACGLNFFDGLMVEGKYQTRPELPFTPGSEVAGVIAALGPDVTSLKIGQRVLAYSGTGGYAEKVVADESRVLAIPGGMSFPQAAGFIITYATSHHALKDRARLQPGETLLVLGAAGGVGLTAVEIGKQMGARVIAAASTQEKLDLCRSYGADHTILYSQEDLRQRVKELTGAKGADVIYDPVGDRFTEQAVRSLAVNGRHLVVGFAAGEIPKIPANLLLLKQAALLGVFWGAFARANPDRHSENMNELFGWFEQGRLRPHISAQVELPRFAEALDMVMERKARGKVVLVMDEHDASHKIGD